MNTLSNLIHEPGFQFGCIALGLILLLVFHAMFRFRTPEVKDNKAIILAAHKMAKNKIQAAETLEQCNDFTYDIHRFYNRWSHIDEPYALDRANDLMKCMEVKGSILIKHRNDRIAEMQ